MSTSIDSSASERRARAEDSVARRFSRAMKASTSRYGVLTDPPIVALASAATVMFLLGAMQSDAPPTVISVAQILAPAPVVIAALVTLALSGSRRRIIDWLATLPFSLDNMNGALNGVGDSIEIRFSGDLPEKAALNASLDAVHPDVFITTVDEEQKSVEVRIGVIDSKRNPAVTNYLRVERLRKIVERVLVPLAESHPIQGIYVK